MLSMIAEVKQHISELSRTDWLLTAGIVFCAILARIVPGLRIIDDAYITYRYAYNIASGLGFVYNVGEAVLGTTTPLYTLLMAATGIITGNSQAIYPQASVIWNALFDAAGCVLLYLIARRLFSGILVQRIPGLMVALIWAIAPRSVTFAIGGMETSLYISLMLGAFCTWLYQSTRISAGLTALAFLTRPDALIWAGPLGIAMIIAHWLETTDKPLQKRIPWIEGGVFAGIILPWVLFSWVNYGSLLTNSVSAKAVAYIIEPLQALTTLLGVYITIFAENVVFGEGLPLVIASIVYLFLYIIGSVFFIRQTWHSLPIILFPWLYLITFAAANPLIFRWYGSPPIPILMLLAVGGVWTVMRDRAGIKTAQRTTAVIGTIWLSFSLTAWELNPDHGPNRPAPEMAWFELELLYADAAQSLPQTDGAVVAAGDIGAVGWYSNAPLLDTLGLVSPQSIEFYPLEAEQVVDTTAYAIAPELIEQETPDYIITLEAYVRNTLLQSDSFEEQYTLIRTLPTGIYGSEGMLVFERSNRGG